MRAKKELEAEQRERMVDAAERFFRAFQIAVHRLRDASNYAIDAPEFRGTVTDYTPERQRETLAAAIKAIDEMQAELASVRLFFGSDAAVFTTADELLTATRETRAVTSATTIPQDYVASLRPVFAKQQEFDTAFAAFRAQMK
jgi:hypothetical protein